MIALTGGAGFIGSCILSRLNALGCHDIIVVDHLNHEGKKQNLHQKKFSKYFDKTEFLKLVQNGRLDTKLDVMIHMGACSSTVLPDAKYYEENNFQYSRILGEWCLVHHVKMIYASSAATYGDGHQGYGDDEAQTRRLKPLNFYGQSKQKFDLWVLDHAADQFVGLKFFNVFGPNEYHKGEMKSVVAKNYERVAKEGRIGLFKSYKKEFADGEQKRDFIYVKDAVDIVMHFFDNRQLSGIYNAGSGEARAWNDVAKALFSAVGKTPQIDYIEMPVSMREKYQYFTEADMSKLRKSGYQKPFRRLEDTIKDYVGYLKNSTHI